MMPTAGRVLVVDDEEVICKTLRIYLESEGYTAQTVQSGRDAVRHLETGDTEVLLLDILMPQMNGLEVMQWIRERELPVEVIVTTGAGSHDVAVEAMRLGAFDILRKPILNLDEKLLPAVRQAVDRYRLRSELAARSADVRRMDRWLSDVYHFGLGILRAADDTALVDVLAHAVKTFCQNGSFVLFRAHGEDTFHPVERTDVPAITIPQPPSAPFIPTTFSLPLPPSVCVFPLAVRNRTVGMFALGGLDERESEELTALLSLLPAVACSVVAGDFVARNT
jgi:FixJ family two-component response regulator